MERKTVLDADIEKVLISAKELDALTDKIAGEIDRDYRDSGNRLLLLCILKGSVVFMGDLMKKLTCGYPQLEDHPPSFEPSDAQQLNM